MVVQLKMFWYRSAYVTFPFFPPSFPSFTSLIIITAYMDVSNDLNADERIVGFAADSNYEVQELIGTLIFTSIYMNE